MMRLRVKGLGFRAYSKSRPQNGIDKYVGPFRKAYTTTDWALVKGFSLSSVANTIVSLL